MAQLIKVLCNVEEVTCSDKFIENYHLTAAPLISIFQLIDLLLRPAATVLIHSRTDKDNISD